MALGVLRARVRRLRYRVVFAVDRWVHRRAPRCACFGGCHWHVGHKGPCDPLVLRTEVIVARDGTGDCDTLNQAFHLVKRGGYVIVKPAHTENLDMPAHVRWLWANASKRESRCRS